MKEGEFMAFSYKPLWCMLTEKGISKTVFREKLNLSTATLAKLSADKAVSSEVLARICEFFGCGLNDVVVYVSDIEQFFINISDDILGYGYTIYGDKWPECRIELTKGQFNYIYSMTDVDLKALILTLEKNANEKHFPNVGILGSTRIKFDITRQMMIISGSFAVTEGLLVSIINNTK